MTNKERCAARYANKREEHLAYMRQYYREHAEQQKAQARKRSQIRRIEKREELNAYGREYYRKNKTEFLKRNARNRLRRKYGLTPDVMRDMRALQHGLCLICNQSVRLCIDHCHKTGKIRGLLCVRCNLLIGQADDRSDLLRKAANYLDAARFHGSEIIK